MKIKRLFSVALTLVLMSALVLGTGLFRQDVNAATYFINNDRADSIYQVYKKGDYDVCVQVYPNELKYMNPRYGSGARSYFLQDNGTDKYGEVKDFNSNSPSTEEFVAAYNNANPNEQWDPTKQFRINTGNWNNGTKSSSFCMIGEIGGCYFIYECRPGETFFFDNDFVLQLYEDLKKNIHAIKNVNGNPIPGLDVSKKEVEITVSEKTHNIHVFTFSAAPEYNWDEPGNNINVDTYQGQYPADRAEQNVFVTIHKPADPAGSGETIAEFVFMKPYEENVTSGVTSMLLTQSREKVLLTSDEEWEEYFSDYLLVDGRDGYTREGLIWNKPEFSENSQEVNQLLDWLGEGNLNDILSELSS